MTSHHHPPGRHPVPTTIAPSILRLSLAERIAGALVLVLLLWGVVYWALG